MAVKKTREKRTLVYNPKRLYITPYTDDKTIGSTQWSCQDVIRDSTTITQEDNTENPIENELESTPIINNIIAGSYTFATEIGDLQSDLLSDLLGFKVDAKSKTAYAPDGYVEKFAKIEMVFQAGEKYRAVVIPKLQLSPTITLDSMSTTIGRIALGGTALTTEVTDGSNKYQTPFYIVENYTLPDETGGEPKGISISG